MSSIDTRTLNAINGTSSSSSSSASSSGGNAAMDKQAFLKLLTAQMSAQDPLQPMQGTEFVTQLAQFAIVEQSTSQTTALTNIQTQLSGLASSDATSLVGKQVTVRATQGTGDAATTSDVTGTVTKVGFDQGYPQITLSDGTTASIASLVSVGAK